MASKRKPDSNTPGTVTRGAVLVYTVTQYQRAFGEAPDPERDKSWWLHREVHFPDGGINPIARLPIARFESAHEASLFNEAISNGALEKLKEDS